MGNVRPTADLSRCPFVALPRHVLMPKSRLLTAAKRTCRDGAPRTGFDPEETLPVLPASHSFGRNLADPEGHHREMVAGDGRGAALRVELGAHDEQLVFQPCHRGWEGE